MRHVKTNEYSLHYRDYEYKCYKPNISFLNAMNVDINDYILVGNTVHCIECSKVINECNSLYCESCSDDGYVTCYNCDRREHGDIAHYINGYWYCDDCCSYCEHCQEYTVDEITNVHNSRGYSCSVCRDCLEKNYYYCEDCDEYFDKDSGYQIDGSFHCNDCIETNYCICEDCGEYVNYDNSEEVNSIYYCESCAKDIRENEEEAINDEESLESA